MKIDLYRFVQFFSSSFQCVKNCALLIVCTFCSISTHWGLFEGAGSIFFSAGRVLKPWFCFFDRCELPSFWSLSSPNVCAQNQNSRESGERFCILGKINLRRAENLSSKVKGSNTWIRWHPVMAFVCDGEGGQTKVLFRMRHWMLLTHSFPPEQQTACAEHSGFNPPYCQPVFVHTEQTSNSDFLVPPWSHSAMLSGGLSVYPWQFPPPPQETWFLGSSGNFKQLSFSEKKIQNFFSPPK